MIDFQAMNAANPYGQNWQNYAMQQRQMQYANSNYATEVPRNLDCYSIDETSTPVINTVNDEKKKNLKNIALWITGGLLVTGAASAILFASKGKGNSLWGKIKNGADTCWDSMKNVFSSKPKTNEASETVLDTFEMIQNNGRTAIRVPEKTQVLNGKPNTIASAVKDLGIDSVAKELTDATSKVKTSTMVVNHNGTKTFVTLGNSGKIFCKGADGKVLNLADQSAEYQKLVNDSIAAIKAGKLKEVKPNVQIKNIVYDSKIADGTVGTYLRKGGASTGTSEVRRIVTDRFDVDSDVVWQQMKHNRKLEKAVKNAVPKKEHWYSLPQRADYSGWKVRSATHTPTVKNWPSNAKIIIENNEIVGVIENGVRVDATRFDSLQAQFPKAFENVLDKKLDNVIRYL